MHVTREDLDGLRLVEPGKPDVWLMFHGRRHRVCSPQVYEALFSDIEGLVYSDEISSITMGPELNDGTCLIRALGTLAIFLVTGRYPHVTRYYITSYNSFCDFGFNMNAVTDVPSILLDALAIGDDLASPADRRLGT